MPVADWGLAAVTGADGRVYAIGGGQTGPLATVQAYTPATNTWTLAAPLHLARTRLAAVVTADGYIYAMGGKSGGSTMTAVVEVEGSGTSPRMAWSTPAYGPPWLCEKVVWASILPVHGKSGCLCHSPVPNLAEQHEQ